METPKNEVPANNTSIDMPANDTSGLSSGELPVSERVKELNIALADTTIELKQLCKNNTWQIVSLILINALMLSAIIPLGYHFYTSTDYKADWTWQIIYFTAARVLIVSGIATLFIYTLNLLKAYLVIYKINREKYFVIKSMASLVESGSKFTNKEIIYNKLLDIVLSPTPNNLGSSLKHNFTSESLKPLVDLVKTIKEN